MKKILSFFLPQVFLTVTALLVIILFVLLISIILGIDISNQTPLGGLFIWIIFPFAAYFNNRIYLPAHLEWLTLIPLKKSSLVLSNAIINVIKIVCILFASNLLWALFFSTETLSEYFSFSFRLNIKEVMRPIPPDVLRILTFILSMIFCLVTCFITGREFQHSGERRGIGARFRDKKFVSILLLACLFLGGFVYYYQSILDFVPFNIRMASVYSLFITSFTMTAYTANKFYYKKIVPFIVYMASFSLFVGLFVINNHRFLKSDLEKVEEKLEEFTKLGFMTRYYEEDIKKMLLSSSSSISHLTATDLKNLFYLNSFGSLYQEVSSNWNRRCLDGDAIGCRLESSLIYAREGFRPIKKLRMACPQDLRGCYDLINHNSATKEDIALGEEVLIKNCGVSSNSSKSEMNKDACCSCFHSYLKNKKKNEIKK